MTAASGLVIVDKPAGLTSHDVVARIRRLAGTRRVGHAGTLDPMATGVLVVGVEKATRLLGHLALTEKEYSATIRLGQATDYRRRRRPDHDRGRRRRRLRGGAGAPPLAALTGEIQQVPPAISAIKVAGQRAYRLTRAGAPPGLAARTVTVSQLVLTALRPPGDLMDVDVRVTCSSGTYIRAIARDLGAALGVGGHLTALRRTRVGPYTAAMARTLDELAASLTVIPLAEAAAAAFPRRELTADEAAKVSHGGRLPATRPGQRAGRRVWPGWHAGRAAHRGSGPGPLARRIRAVGGAARTLPRPARRRRGRLGAPPDHAGSAGEEWHMQRWQGLADVPDGWGCSVVTIGVFDGVHRGHQRIVGRAAEMPGSSPCRWSWSPSTRTRTRWCGPARIRRSCAPPGGAPSCWPGWVSTRSAAAVHATSSPGSGRTSSSGRCWPTGCTRRAWWSARTSGSATGRPANVALLAELGEKYDFTAEGVPLLAEAGVTISSTGIRELLAAGDVAGAARDLGRPHRVEGVVVRGHQRGRALGFPTANLETLPHTAIPADGVYAGWLASLDPAGVEEERWPAAISVGTNPTFDGRERTVEAYALDRDDLDLYGAHVAVDFTARLRGTVRFDSVDDLVDPDAP